MLIAHVTFRVAPENAKAALEALTKEAATVRAMPGCIKFVPFQDGTDAQSIGVIHEWDSADNFRGYAASLAFAQVGQTLRPLMLEPPISDRFDARLLDSVN